MTHLQRICLFALFCFTQHLGAQDAILQIRELPRTKRDTVEIRLGGLPIIDINSALEIRPNATAIQAAAQSRFPQFFKDRLLQSKAARIDTLLSNQKRIVDLTRELLDGADVGRDLRREVRSYIRKVQNDPQLRKDYNQYLAEFDLRYSDDPNPPDPFIYSIERFNEQLDQISTDLKSIASGAKVQFSIAAFRRDAGGGARIHVENFDEMENGEFFSVPRWVTSLSGNDQKQLENYRQLAQGLNDDANQVLQAYKGKLVERFQSIECTREIRSHLDSAIQLAPDDLKAALRQFNDGETEPLITLFSNLKSDLQNWPPTQSPSWQNRLGNLFIKLDTVSRRFDRTFGGETSSVLAANPHLRHVNACLKRTMEDLTDIQAFVRQFPSNYLNKLSLNSEELAEEILAFDLNNIPEAGIIDLEYTGRRKSGDELLIKAVLRLPDDSTANRSTGHSLEARRLKMVLIGAHTTTKVGLIMANPYTLDVPDDTPKFRFAPSAALILKFGSRKSHFYNNFLDLGIGLNSAAPDFNLDGTPEFSAGLTGTIFRDILSIGWDWNFGLNRPNYFIGIHLPFNLPGVPVNTIQDNPLPEN